MTDLAVSTIQRALTSVHPGDHYSVDDFRPAAAVAQLRPAEISAAMRWAVDNGWLRPIPVSAGLYACKPTTHGPAKGRMVLVYQRTRLGPRFTPAYAESIRGQL